MQDIVSDLRKWMQTKTIPEESSLYLLGSCADLSDSPGDLDLVWISTEVFPEKWVKELSLFFGLPLDLCVVSSDDFVEASLHPFHPLAFVTLAVNFQGQLIAGPDIKYRLGSPDENFIRHVRQIQGLREWMNFQDNGRNKILQKVILSLSIYERLIPWEAGRTKKEMHENLIQGKNELAAIYQTLLKGEEMTPEILNLVKTHIDKMNDLTWAQGELVKGRWQIWDLQGKTKALIPAANRDGWSDGEEFNLQGFKL